MSSRRSAVPGFAIAFGVLIGGLLAAFTVGRYPVGLGDLIGCAGEGAWPSRGHFSRHRNRYPAGTRAARSRCRTGRSCARACRHGISRPVPQPAGIARHPRRVLGCGSWCRDRHLSFPRRLRYSSRGLRRRSGRSRGSLCDRLGGTVARSDPRSGADRRRRRITVRGRRWFGEISCRSLQPAPCHDLLAAWAASQPQQRRTSSLCSVRSPSVPSC